MLRVTVLELPASWAEPMRVLSDVDALIASGPATDLVLLPEAALTGYVSPEGDFDLRRFAEPEPGASDGREGGGGPLARAAAAVSKRHGVHLVAPLVVERRGRFYNSMVAFAPDGSTVFAYHKRHPWFPETWASPGQEPPPLVRVGDVLVTIAICFDAHFIDEDQAELLSRADLLLFPSAWVDEDETKRPLLESIARRFAVAVANANWAPGVVRVPGQGSSCILDARGVEAARVTRSAVGATRLDAIIGGTPPAAPRR